MPQFQIHFLTHGDTVFGSHQFEAADDTAAIAYASVVYHTGIGKGFEIWRDDKQVHTEMF